MEWFKYFRGNKWVSVVTLALILLQPVGGLAAATSAVAEPASVIASQDALTYYMNLVETLDVTTAIGKSVFYSGPGNRKLAEEFAWSDDKTTLEMTPGGKILDDLKLFEKGSPLTPEQAMLVWKRLSQRYAEQAAGDVYCFVTGARPSGVFTTVELPELRKNRKIGSIYSVGKI